MTFNKSNVIGMKVFSRALWLRAVVLCIVAFVPLLVLAAISNPDTSSLHEIAQQTAREFDRIIALRQQEVFSIATFPSVRVFAASSPETRSERAAVALNELQAWVVADTNIREAFIVDSGGIVIMTTLEGWNQDISTRQFIQEALMGQIAVSPVAHDRDEFSNYYAAPVLNNDKNIVGALVIRVAAQELWGVTPHGERYFAVLSDENGMRLDDTGDPARRLMTFGAPDAGRETRIVKTQLYGTQELPLRATNLARAQELMTQGALDQITGADFGVAEIAAQRLVSKPWTVLIEEPQASAGDIFVRMGMPVIVAILVALAGTLILTRL